MNFIIDKLEEKLSKLKKEIEEFELLNFNPLEAEEIQELILKKKKRRSR